MSFPLDPESGHPDSVLRKHSAAMSVIADLDLNARLGWDALVHHAYWDLMSREEHVISVADFFGRIRCSTHDYAYAKRIVRQLLAARVEWNVLGKGPDDEEWTGVGLLAGAKVGHGVIRYTFGLYLREFLFAPRVWARLDLALAAEFKTTAGHCLLNLATDYTVRDRRNAARFGVIETPVIDLETFKGLLGVSDRYPRFTDFRRYVLDPAVEEVVEKAGYLLDYTTTRRGRAVTGVKVTGRVVGGPQLNLLTQGRSTERPPSSPR